jgi:hypothetical protein
MNHTAAQSLPGQLQPPSLTMSAARIAEASLLNNQGAIYYSQGKLAEAMTCFRSALEGMVSVINDPAINANVAHGPGTISPSAVASLHLSRLRREIPQYQDPRDTDFISVENPIVFDELISQNQEAELVFCGVVVFNMAITSQAKATPLVSARPSSSMKSALTFSAEPITKELSLPVLWLLL